MIKIKMHITGKSGYLEEIMELKVYNLGDHVDAPKYANYEIKVKKRDKSRKVKVFNHERILGIESLLVKVFKKLEKYSKDDYLEEIAKGVIKIQEGM